MRFLRLARPRLRDRAPKRPQVLDDVVRIEDQRHPRGYREVCSVGELARRRDTKLREQQGLCAICWKPVRREPSVDHVNPRGMGGALRDDHVDNLQGAHRYCNERKGSRRYMDKPMIGPYLYRLRATHCICGRAKPNGKPFCSDCIDRLSGQTRMDLERFVPAALTDPKAQMHARACENAERELLANIG